MSEKLYQIVDCTYGLIIVSDITMTLSTEGPKQMVYKDSFVRETACHQRARYKRDIFLEQIFIYHSLKENNFSISYISNDINNFK